MELSEQWLRKSVDKIIWWDCYCCRITPTDRYLVRRLVRTFAIKWHQRIHKKKELLNLFIARLRRIWFWCCEKTPTPPTLFFFLNKDISFFHSAVIHSQRLRGNTTSVSLNSGIISKWQTSPLSVRGRRQLRSSDAQIKRCERCWQHHEKDPEKTLPLLFELRFQEGV